MSQMFDVRELSKSSHTFSVEHVDINNDGIIDILLLGQDFSYYLGLGNNEYSMKHTIFDYSYSNFVNNPQTRFSLADITGNGYLDILYCSSFNQSGGANNDTHVLIMIRNDEMNFSFDTLGFNQSAAFNMMLVDIDQDGDLDIVTSNYSIIDVPYGQTTINYGYYTRSINNGNGEFTNAYVDYNYISWLWSPSTNPFKRTNHNSIFEKAFIHERNYYMSVSGGTTRKFEYIRYENGQMFIHDFQHLNNTNFIPNASSNNYPIDAAFMDINNDGIDDVIMPYTFSSAVQYYFGTGSSFSNLQNDTVNVRPQPKRILAVDLDFDEREDVLWVTDTQVSWYKVDTLGDFIYQGELYNNIEAGGITKLDYLDVNNDGFNDIIISGGRSIWHIFNNGDNTYTSHKVVLRLPFTGVSPIVVDLDGDGLNDLVYGTTSQPGLYPEVTYQKNLGNGIFSEDMGLDRNNVFRKLGPYSFDMNNDGFMDIIYFGNVRINNVWFNDRIVIFYNDGLGNFNNPQVVISNLVEHLVIKDIDGDGHIDMAYVFKLSSVSSQRRVAFLKNNGNASSFTENIIYTSFNSQSLISAADFNCDGQVDIIIKESNTLKFFINNNGTFSGANSVTMNYNATRFAMADFNNDGFNDLLYISSNSSNNWNAHYYLLYNNGSGSFVNENLFHVFPYQNPPPMGHFEIVDFDQDGDLDFFISDIPLYGSMSFGSVQNRALYYFQNNLTSNSFSYSELPYEMGGSQHFTVGNIDDSSDYEIVQIGGRGTWLKSAYNVETGQAPIFVSDTINACAGDSIYIEITNSAALGDNTTWALFANNCDENPIQLSENGSFVVVPFSNTAYFVRAVGGIQYSGPCSQILVVLSGISAPDIQLDFLSENQAIISLDPAYIMANTLEFSVNNDSTWTLLDALQTEVVFDGLSPNTCYSVAVRSVDSSVCSLNPVSIIEFCTDCLTFETWDTLEVCYEQPYIFPDGYMTYNLVQPFSRSFVMPSSYGCDSLVHSYLLPIVIQNITLYDTICKNENYTLLNNDVLYNVQQSYTASHPIINSIGCLSGNQFYNVFVKQTVSSYDTVNICQGESITFPDGMIFENIEFDFNYSYNISSSVSCDSTIITAVEIDYLFIGQTEYAEICEGQGYSFFDNVFFESGVYSQNVSFPDQCDSVFYLNLQVLPSIEMNTIFDTICNGESYLFYNELFFESGIYEVNQFDLDSCFVHLLDLEVINCDINGIDNFLNDSIYAFPNPAVSVVHVVSKNGSMPIQLSLYNSEYKLIKLVANSDFLDVSDVQSGLYILSVHIDDRIYRLKIVVFH